MRLAIANLVQFSWQNGDQISQNSSKQRLSTMLNVAVAAKITAKAFMQNLKGSFQMILAGDLFLQYSPYVHARTTDAGAQKFSLCLMVLRQKGSWYHLNPKKALSQFYLIYFGVSMTSPRLLKLLDLSTLFSIQGWTISPVLTSNLLSMRSTPAIFSLKLTLLPSRSSICLQYQLKQLKHDHNGICVKYFFKFLSILVLYCDGSTTVASGPFIMFSTHSPAPNSRMQSTTPIWKRLPSRQQSSEFSISTTRMREQSMTLLQQRYSRVDVKFLSTLSLQKMGQLWRSIRKLTSRGMTGGLENRLVTEPLKSQRYHSFMPKNKFSMTMKQSDDMFLLMIKAPQMGVRMLPQCRCLKYLERDFLKVMNSPLGIFLMTSRSLYDRMKGDPDFPPVAIQ